MNIKIPMRVRLKGYYRIEVLDGATGDVKKDSGWFPNLITNQGLDFYGDASANLYAGSSLTVCDRCAVGTSGTTPTIADTVLNSPLAQTPLASGVGYQPGSWTTSYVAGPPAYWSSVLTYNFALGAVVGNIAEVGTGINKTTADTTPYLFSHALIVDGGGTPTTISVTSADQLRVTFELRHYLDLTDSAYSLTISGIGYTGNIRRARVTTTSNIKIMLQADRLNSAQPINPILTAYNGSIGTTTTIPSGASETFPTLVGGSYTLGSYSNSYTFSGGTGDLNLSGGISALMFSCNFGNWQLSVSPALAKDNTKTISLVFTLSWARYP